MMKGIFGVFTVAMLIALVHSYPGVRREIEDADSMDNPNTDTLLVLPGHRFPVRPLFGGIGGIDEDNDDDILMPFGGGDRFDPFRSNPFEGILNSMQKAMNSLRERMASAIAGVGFGPWGMIPEGANTTSTTKVIDGHVVTINETVYKGEGDDNSFFRIRVIDVHPETATEDNQSSGEVTEITPENQTESTKEETTPTRSIETVEDEKNEIPDSQVDTLKA